MSGWLLDTNVVSELRRPRPSRKVIEFLEAVPVSKLFISVVTFAEIRNGIDLTPDPARRSHILHWLDQELRPMFRGRVLELNEDVMLNWIHIVDGGKKHRHTFSYPDVLIAAIAAHYDLTIATRNVGDFDLTGVAVFNPWIGS